MNKPNEDKLNEREALTPVDAAFERQLAAAMKRVNAPESMANFLMTAAEAETAAQVKKRPILFKPSNGGRILSFPRMPVPRLWMGGALAAALTLGVFVGGVTHVRHERERAEATRQFDEAQEITNRALAHARAQIQRAGISLDDE